MYRMFKTATTLIYLLPYTYNTISCCLVVVYIGIVHCLIVKVVEVVIDYPETTDRSSKDTITTEILVLFFL